MSEYDFRIDDLFLSLLDAYHDIEPQDAMAFFGDRLEEMRTCKPNITSNSRSPRVMYDPKLKKTVNKVLSSSTKGNAGINKFYVLRGFYPETHLPFKMVAIMSDSAPLYAKIQLGGKDHKTAISGKDVNDFKDALADSELLGTTITPYDYIEYEFRKFKCMRPKGMELYHEKKKR